MVLRHTFLLVIGAAAALAQVNSFPRPSYFRETFAHPATEIELAPPVRLEDFVVEGKDGKVLELSLRDYLGLVMANNTNIAIQRLNIVTAQDAITRAFSVFDPKLTASWNSTRSKSPVSNLVDIGQVGNAGITTSSLDTLRQPATFNWSQLLPAGTIYNVQFAATKFDTSSHSVTYNP